MMNKHRRHMLLIVLALIFAIAATAQAGSSWSKTIGGGAAEIGNAIAGTSDGGFIVAGATASFGAGSDDAWIIKMDSAGAVQWQKTYGTSIYEVLWNVHQLPDGGYIAAGSMYSNYPDSDAWILRLDASGNVVWQKTFGGSGYDEGLDARPTADGGFIVALNAGSFAATSSVWLLKLNSFGSVQWQKIFDSAGEEAPLQVLATSDQGSLVVAYTSSFGSGNVDAWLLKLDSTGNVQWQKTYGSSMYDILNSVQQTSDGGYIAAGTSNLSTSDVAVVKLDPSGSIQWQKTYGGPAEDVGLSIAEAVEGGYVVAGLTNSFGAGSYDAWVLRLDSAGNVQWQKSYGGAGNDRIASIIQAADGSFVLAGTSATFAVAGIESVWVVKLAPDGQISENCPLVTDTFATPVLGSLNSTTTTAVPTSPSPTIATTGVVPSNSLATEAVQCETSCLFCDDFEDGILATDWTYLKPAWSESGGNLVAAPVRKAVAIASPAFAGCTNCAFEASMMSAGGTANTLWMLPWYSDKNNTLEILMKEENNKFIIRQRSGGVIVAKAKGLRNIDPNVAYTVRVEFDGALFTLFVDSDPIATMTAAASVHGTIGFEAKNTTAKFGNVLVEQ